MHDSPTCNGSPCLRELFDQRGLKLTWAAEQVGISRSYLSSIVHGRRRLTPPTAARLSTLLGIPEDELMAAAGERQP
ncbi:helix-turn-helix transcriptional regulator [Tepidiforma sp.]|uniref:helix-turn-helix domain-containing protein n=1 Tax=Tepidiforma sp. TaxID=2682230 RepID=UPI002623E04B|nr:helix-turn-helix transcriptional regulator [Tepidiforma sp.]MCX7617090.1 helix-turn-helix transcriptional regulator [Tepidiforma sp.]